MKLVSLNCWGGRVHQPLLSFIRDQSSDTDIFCFQEVFKNTAGHEVHREYRANLFNEFAAILNSFEGDFVPASIGHGINYKPVDYDLSFGTAIFIRKSLNAKFASTFILEADNASHTYHEEKYLHSVALSGMEKPLTIATIHGLWIANVGKVDTPERITQSKAVRAFLDSQSGETILCGDLNLNPDTESLKILKEGYQNLIADFEVPTTRNHFYKKPEKFADYTFVSKGIDVDSFEVPNVPISDHLPMVLEFELK